MPDMIEGATYFSREGLVSSPVRRSQGASLYPWVGQLAGLDRTWMDGGHYSSRDRESPLDLVQLASLPGRMKPIDQMSLEDWRANIAKVWDSYRLSL